MWRQIDDLPSIATALVAMIAGGGLAQLLSAFNARRNGDYSHTRELHAQMLDGLAQIAEAAKEEAEAARHRARLLDDYAHVLREHIAEGLEPPPPDWPEGL